MQIKSAIFFILVLFCFCSTSSFAEKTIQKDFNEDGIPDTLTRSYGGGSGFGWTTVKVVNGQNKEEFSVTTGGSFSDFMNIVPLDSKFFEKRNLRFFQAIEQELFKSKAKHKPDISLQWLLSYTLQEANAGRNKLFSKIVTVKPVWAKGAIQVPDTYHMLIEGELLDNLQSIYCEKYGDASDDKRMKAWLVYYGHNHGRQALKLCHRRDATVVYKTTHGVIVQRNHVYAWFFVSDRLGKLRWPSIRKVGIVDNFVFLVQSNPVSASYLHVIDIDTGKCARFDPGFLGFGGLDITEFAIHDRRVTLFLGANEGPSDERKTETSTITMDEITRYLQ